MNKSFLYNLKKLQSLSILLLAFIFLFFFASPVFASYTFLQDSFTAPDNTNLFEFNSLYSPAYDFSGPMYINNNEVTGGYLWFVNNVPTNNCTSIDTYQTFNDGATAYLMQYSDGYLYHYKTIELTLQNDYLVRVSINGAATQNDILTLQHLNLSDGWHNVKMCIINKEITAYIDNNLIYQGAVPSAYDWDGRGNKVMFYQNIGTDFGYEDNLLITSYDNLPNTPPSVGLVTITPNPVEVNTSLIATGTFIDQDTSDTHTAIANWDDGTPSTTCSVTENNGSGTITCVLSLGYTNADIYSPIITVTDNHGASDNSSPFEYLAVYKPTPQGLFSGASKFTTPVGSYAADTSLSGQVKFGITAKYEDQTPTGKASMEFKAANFEFESTSVTILVTSNGKATLRGTGTVNGAGSYTFLATGIDDANDTIRFQIKDSSNTIVYDSQQGATDTTNPTASVTGQVIVH